MILRIWASATNIPAEVHRKPHVARPHRFSLCCVRKISIIDSHAFAEHCAVASCRWSRAACP
jgi:hypothetical protein